MEVCERINLLIEEKGLTKREFAKRLIALEPKSKRTGETMGEKAVYAYLSGKSVIDANLVSYMAEALHVSEQSLFEENEKVRARLIRYLLESLSDTEKEILRQFCLKKIIPERYSSIIQLLPYASESILRKIEQTLLEMKSIGEKM